jgi:hypothetical protein
MQLSRRAAFLGSSGALLLGRGSLLLGTGSALMVGLTGCTIQDDLQAIDAWLLTIKNWILTLKTSFGGVLPPTLAQTVTGLIQDLDEVIKPYFGFIS